MMGLSHPPDCGVAVPVGLKEQNMRSANVYSGRFFVQVPFRNSDGKEKREETETEPKKKKNEVSIFHMNISLSLSLSA